MAVRYLHLLEFSDFSLSAELTTLPGKALGGSDAGYRSQV